MMSPPVLDSDLSNFRINLAPSSPISLLLTKMARRPAAVWLQLLSVDGTLNMVAPSTMAGVTGRTGMDLASPLLIPILVDKAFAASVSASIAVRGAWCAACS